MTDTAFSEQVAQWRDEAAQRQNESDGSTARYWEGKRDAFDIVLWALRGTDK